MTVKNRHARGPRDEIRGPCDEIDDFIRKEKRLGLKDTPLEMYRKDLASLYNYLKGHYKITLLGTKPHHIERYLTHRKEQGMKPETVNQRIRTFNSFFTYMCDAGLMEENPINDVLVAQLTVEPSSPPTDEKPSSSLKTREVAVLIGKWKIPELS